MRVGIVGTGTTFGVADLHAAALLRIPGVQIGAVYTRRAAKGKEFVHRHGLTAAVCGSYEELLEKSDGVCICSPNYTHAAYALKALQAGKGVLCEKPVEGSEEELRLLLKEAEKQKAGHMAGFNYRYSWENRKLRELTEQGRLGQIYTFYQRKGGSRLADENVPYEWRMDREKSFLGAAIDFGSHMLDNFLYIGNYAPEEVSVSAAQMETYIKRRKADSQSKLEAEENLNYGGYREVTTDDTALLILETKDGGRAALDCSRIGCGFEEIQVVGSKGAAFFTQAEPDKLYLWEKDEAGRFPGKPSVLQKEAGAEEDTYYLQACDWIQAVREGKELPCSLELACREAFLFREIAMKAFC